MIRRLLRAQGQSRSAKTVEVFGWLILLEGTIVLFAPHLALSILGMAPLGDQAAHYFRALLFSIQDFGSLLWTSIAWRNVQGIK